MTTKKPRKQKAPSLIPVELIDQLLAQVQNKDAESILGEAGLAGQHRKLLASRMLTAELNHYLANGAESGNNVTAAAKQPYWPLVASLGRAIFGSFK